MRRTMLLLSASGLVAASFVTWVRPAAAAPSRRTVAIEVRSAAQSPGSLQQIADDAILLLTVFNDGTVISKDRLYATQPSRVAAFRDDLIASGAATSGETVIGEPLADLGSEIEIRLGSGRTTLGFQNGSFPSPQHPISRAVTTFVAALAGDGANVPAGLVHRHVIYETSEDTRTLLCFPVSASRGAKIRRVIPDDGEASFFVGDRKVFDLAVTTSYGRPPSRLTSFDDFCRPVASKPVRVKP